MGLAVIDTEFTSIDSPALLSVGLVTLDGAELYLEVDPDSPLGRRRLAAASQFVRDFVSPLIGFARAASCSADDEIAHRVRAWLGRHGVAKIVADSSVDFFLLRAIGGLPEGIATAVVQAEYAPAHHALEDARRLAASLNCGASAEEGRLG